MAAKLAAAAAGLGLWAKKYGLLVAKAVIGLLYGSEPRRTSAGNTLASHPTSLCSRKLEIATPASKPRANL